MNAALICTNHYHKPPAHQASKVARATVVVFLLGVGCDLAISRAQPADQDLSGAQVLTRGPVHEAFAGMVTFNPEPGAVVTKPPPDAIEEVPPGERPEGDNVAWIPGYWAWDDERGDFLWISGTWRALPPGRQWMAGYWGQTPQGYQWTSGYWADAAARETTYLPPPPPTVEVGPNVAAPSIDYGWTPGCWIWYQGRYAWGPGYWAQGQADWDWMPAHYVWTPRGHIFVGGYWDYPVARRGLLFAPVYFESGLYARRGFFYSPTIVINLGVFSDHLFLRPRYGHYYFGDYYAPSYSLGGFYASFSFQSSRYGYDPIYSHQRWEHRQDREWEQRVETSYQNRRDHENARPPRTWVAQRTINPSAAESTQNRLLVAMPIDQLAKQKDSPIRFQPVTKEERPQLARRGKEVEKSRDERRTLEAQVVGTTARKPSGVIQPAKAILPRSPIVAKPANQLGRNPAPPRLQQSPKPDPKFQPKPVTAGRQPYVDRSNPKPQLRQLESEKEFTPGPSQAAPRPRQVQSEAQPRAKDAAVKTQEEFQRNARGLEQKAQPEAQQRAHDPALNAREASPRNATAMEPRVQRISEPPANARPGAGDKGATKLFKNDRQQQGKGRPAPPDYPPATPPASP